MNNQAETPPPDFGFILNQDQPPVNTPKKSKKTIILVSVALALVVVTAGLYAFLPKDTPTQTAIPSVGAPTSSELLQKFVTYLQANQPTDAFSLLSSDYQAKQNLDTFTNQFVNVMNKNVKFDSCVEVPATESSQSNSLQTACLMQRGSGKTTFTITTQTSSQDGKDKVTIDTIAWQPDDKVLVADVQ